LVAARRDFDTTTLVIRRRGRLNRIGSRRTTMAQAHILIGAPAHLSHLSIRQIGASDIADALKRGWDDFSAMPSHALFLCIIYPIIGIAVAGLTLGYALVPLLYPLAAGFALLGPVAAIGLYELSRRREEGAEVDAADAFRVLHSPSIGAIVALGLLLALLFLVWVGTAHAIYVANFGYAMPSSIGSFMHDVLTTSAGWRLIVIGNAVGFLFAVTALIVSVVSFPLLLDRDVGAAVALVTSARAVLANPVAMALWGLVVALLLFLGSLPAFLGLPVVLPVLGHATWHLYRKVVERDPMPHTEHRPRHKGARYAADFPAVLFPWAKEDRP
jgi:uncharacterized membrane protein